MTKETKDCQPFSVE